MFWLVVAGVGVLAVAAAAVYCFTVWKRRAEYTRERFAFAGLSAITSLTVSLIASIDGKKTPWSAIAELGKVAFGLNIEVPETRFSDHLLMVLIYAIAVGFVMQMYKNWGGLTSLDQYRRDQRSESSSLFVDGLQEVKRIAKREPPPIAYVGPSSGLDVRPLEQITDSLAWRDQARDLIRLSSSSYTFDPESGWHDKAQVWVGTNINTRELVLLLPSQGPVPEGDLNSLVAYADRVAELEDKGIAELIVAVRNGGTVEQRSRRGRVIRFETQSALLDRLVNFEDYRNEIRRRVLYERLPDSDLVLEDVYVPSRYESDDPGGQDGVAEEYILRWLAAPGQRQVALLGEYGQGKSTAALMLSYRLLFDSGAAAARIPILIELRGTSPRNHTPLQLLGAWSSKYNINPQALLRLHIEGRLLLIFEGFDEMALVGDQEMRLKHFKTIWQFCYPLAKIIITGRPNFFLDDKEMLVALGIGKPTADGPYGYAMRLSPFGPAEIAGSLRRHKPMIREQICSLVEKNPRFSDLVSRPSLLHIVSVLWEKERLSDRVDQLTPASLMEIFVRHSYRRQGLKEADSPDFMALTTAEREYFMNGIAAFMAAKGLPNRISAMQLSTLIEDLIAVIPDAVSEQPTTMSGESRKPLRLRLLGSEDAIEHVKTDVRACGLLTDDAAAPGTFKFGHKSFMEYLFAAVLVNRMLRDEAVSRTIIGVTGASFADILWLPVSIDFLSQLLTAGVTGANPGTMRSGKDMSDQSYRVASMLLNILLGHSILARLAGRVRMVFRSYITSIIATRKSFLFFFVTPFLIMMAIASILIVDILYVHELSIGFYLPTFILTCCAIIFCFYEIIHGSRLDRAIALWIIICGKLDIPDAVLHRLAGTSLLPWAKGQDFNRLLAGIMGRDSQAGGGERL